MAFLVSKRPNATHGTPSKRENSQFSIMKSPSTAVQQSSKTPSTSSLRNKDGNVNLLNENDELGIMDDQGQEEIDEFGAMSTDLSTNLRRSTLQGRPISNRNSIVSRVSTIFTPRKKLTSLTSFTLPGGSTLNHSESSKSATVATSALVEESGPNTCANDYAVRGITRKGFEPVGHIAKPRKRSSILGKFPSAGKTGTRKESTSSSLFPASANIFSSSTLSLAMRKSPESRGSKRKRRASVGGADEWGGLRLIGVYGEDSSGDEIDEIRRPSDLGPEAEVMVEELDDWDGATGVGKDKPLPHLPTEVLSTGKPYSLWDSGLSASSNLDASSSAMQAMNNSQIIANALQFLPTRSEVAALATVSSVFLAGARQILYGCVDLRLNADASSQNGIQDKEARKRKRKSLGRTLERLVGYSLQERDGELFQDTWGFLMDEWPYGWFESDEIGEVDDEHTFGHDDDAESQYTAYSDSDFTTSSRNPSRASFLPDTTSHRRSSGSLHYAAFSHLQRRSESRQQRKHRLHTLLKTLLASVPALTTLMLPAFELGILKYHTAFGLREVTFLNRRMADLEKESMLGWLDGIVSVLKVRLPRLIEGDGEDEAEETTVDDEEVQGKNGVQENTENQNPVVAVTVNVEHADDSQPLSDSDAGDPTLPPRKKKRKTMLIISPSADASPLSSPAAPNFPGTSFPMPPMSPTSLSTPTPTSRPISMLFPHLGSTSPVMRSSPPLTPQGRRTLTPDTTGPGSRNSSPMTPLTPITPMSPVTPFTPSFYLHSSESSSVSALVTTPSPDIERRIHELGKKETLVPALRVLHGPPSIVELLVPRRRKTVREVRMNVHGTIVGGQVKVAQVVKGLARRESPGVDAVGLGIDTKVLKAEEEEEETCTEGQIQTLAFHFTRSVDRRTMEKVLASAGAAIYGDGSSEKGEGEESRRDQGVNTLEVIATCTRHPNSRKTDEVMYKTIHAVLPRYRSLHTLVMRLADPETGDFLNITAPIANSDTLVQTSLPSSRPNEDMSNVTNPPKSADQIDTPQVKIHTSLTLSGHGDNHPETQNNPDTPITTPHHPLTSGAPPASLETGQESAVFAFPRIGSPPPQDAASPALSTGSVRSAEMQKLRDRKMMRRLGSTTQRTDSLLSASLSHSSHSQRQPRPSLTSLSSRPFSDASSSVNGRHGHQDDESDRETILSSSISHKSKNKSVSSLGRSLKRGGSIRENVGVLKSFQSIQSLSIVCATRAIAQVVTAKASNTFRVKTESRSTLGSASEKASDGANVETEDTSMDVSTHDPTTPTAPTSGRATPAATESLVIDIRPLSPKAKGKEIDGGGTSGSGSENNTPPPLPTPPPLESQATRKDLSMSMLTSSQRRHLRAWRKQCSSLSRVLFFNGIVWERDLAQQ